MPTHTLMKGSRKLSVYQRPLILSLAVFNTIFNVILSQKIQFHQHLDWQRAFTL